MSRAQVIPLFNDSSRERRTMTTPLLKLDRIDTFYGQSQVHFGVTVEVPRGEIVCLLGGNASGKSTTMKVILGLHKPRAGTLSGGEQQMLAMARALMSRPKLVCMDEPTMGLSPLYVDKVLDLIRTINGQGVTFFMVEQNASLALQIAHRGYVLQTGRVVLSGEASALLADERIRDAYLGGPLAAQTAS